MVMVCQGNRLWHIKNKGVRQSHASSRNSEAINVWKVTCHPPSRLALTCDDYSFHSFLSFTMTSKSIIKLKLKQASKKLQKELHREKIRARLAKLFFTFASRFHKVRGDLKSVKNGFHVWNIVFSDQICTE